MATEEGETNGTATEGGLILRPVASSEYGEGLPYAPENWPNPGDIWGWKAGKRIHPSGYFKDRYLYLPDHLNRTDNSGSSSKRRRIFASKQSFERYIQESFPDTDLNALFASFSWKIYATESATLKEQHSIAAEDIEAEEDSHSDCQSDIAVCQARNKNCDSLTSAVEKAKYLPDLPCDIFCNKPGFCHDCCCILCCKTVDSTYGGYSYIKCQVKVGDYICGHIAHVYCAIRCYMAGTVGGSVGLDVEYLCRHCDARTDLISHATELLEKCKTIDSRDDIEKILNLGASILRGSQRMIAKELLNRIDLAISKLQCGTLLEDIWKADDDDSLQNAAFLDDGNEMKVAANESPSVVTTGTENNGYPPKPDLSKLEDEIHQVLQALRKSQALEYSIAEEILHGKKRYLQNLYQQLEREKSESACQLSSHSNVLSDAVSRRMEQIRQETMKLEDMKQDMRHYTVQGIEASRFVKGGSGDS
ncbi:protein OBERON 1 isoform X2 [Neltuma alba]|uniref:protein OBERON 1 isoform X2 n=1 Tax=Neltuma alba TaxID=207710 RepID=UPI0010A59A89|nr:protein OBERON 1-like isoform X2 [Prosopis alba]